VRGGGQGARQPAMPVAGLFCLPKMHDLLEQTTRFASPKCNLLLGLV
jgi:hypothetical protein